MAVITVATFEEAQELRSAHGVEHGKGVLILDADHPGAPKHLIEKLLAAAPFDQLVELGMPVETWPWKLDPLVVLVGEGGAAMLAEIEALCPGFTARVS
jgi:hypothetical protein